MDAVSLTAVVRLAAQMTSTTGTTQLKIVLARRVSIAPAIRCDGIMATNTHAHMSVRRRLIAVEPVHVANLFDSGQTREALKLARRIRPDPPLRSLSEAIAVSLWSRVILETGEQWTELEIWMPQQLQINLRDSR